MHALECNVLAILLLMHVFIFYAEKFVKTEYHVYICIMSYCTCVPLYVESIWSCTRLGETLSWLLGAGHYWPTVCHYFSWWYFYLTWFEKSYEEEHERIKRIRGRDKRSEEDEDERENRREKVVQRREKRGEREDSEN